MGGKYWERFGGRFDKYRKSGGGGTENRSTTSGHFQKKNVRKADGTWGYANWRRMGEEARFDKKIIAWDIAPPKEYFEELFRVSRNQIIWGGNYFDLPPTRCFIAWRKTNIPEKFSMAMGEYAWTSFNTNAKFFSYSSAGIKGRFHPTQKPIELYEFCLRMFAKEGDKILDTHAGSASCHVACARNGFQCMSFEVDSEYYKMAEQRIKEAQYDLQKIRPHK